MKGKKIILAFVLALIVCLVLVPCAYADGSEEVVEVKTKDEFVEAVNNEDVDTIVVKEDLDLSDLSDSYALDLSGKTVDLDGNTLTGKNPDEYGNFTVVFDGDDFTVQNGEFSADSGYDGYALFIGDNPTAENVTIKDVTTSGGINVFDTTNVKLENVNATGTSYYAVWCDEGSQVIIESGTYQSDCTARTDKYVLGMTGTGTGSELIINGGEFIVKDNQELLLKAGSTDNAKFVINGGIFNVALDESWLAKGVAVIEIDGKWYVGSSIPVPVVEESKPVAAVVAEAVAEAVSSTVEAVVEGSSTVSLAANQEVVIKVSFKNDSTSGEALEVLSVTINGVQVEFTVAEDGSIVLSPEVIAALGVGTHIIYIRTSEGLVKVTITIAA